MYIYTHIYKYHTYINIYTRYLHAFDAGLELLEEMHDICIQRIYTCIYINAYVKSHIYKYIYARYLQAFDAGLELLEDVHDIF